MTKTNICIAEEQRVLEVIDWLKNEANLTMSRIGDMINDRAKRFSGPVKPKTFDRAWEKFFATGGGKSCDVLWWAHLLQLLTGIKDELRANIRKELSLYASLMQANEHIDDIINYGYFPNQDTLICKIFEASYKNWAPNTDFIPCTDWNEGAKGFSGNRIHVALRDFPSAVAFNLSARVDSKLMFWPFFSFFGYGIFIRTASIEAYAAKRGNSWRKFKELPPEHKTQFLEEQQYLVEKYTDFEWLINKFCADHDCDMEVIARRTTNCNTNAAKTLYVNNDLYTIYCTNPVHIVDLSREPQFEFIPQTGAFHHANFNGLIFKEEYFLRNRWIIERLIKTWFNDIVFFKRELRKVSANNRYKADEFRSGFTTEHVIQELNKETNSKLTVSDLPDLYMHSNSFYSDPGRAFGEFYERKLTDPKAIRNYCEIAQIQLGKPFADEQRIQQVIEDMRINMLRHK